MFMMGWATPVRAVAPSMTDALAERFGLFVIIVLGETVAGVDEGLSHELTNALTIAAGLVAAFVSLGSWWPYFDFAGHRLPRPTRASTVQWLLVQLPLTAAMAAMSAASMGLVEHAHDIRAPAAGAWTLCGGLGHGAPHNHGAHDLPACLAREPRPPPAAAGSSLNPEVVVDAVSGGDRVDQGLELRGWGRVRPGSPPSGEGDGWREPGPDGA
ncbi:low temperature requirement protein A [Streptomyces sp. NPDC059378]|uniref:low temperature requirement protein A n=1 Tax=Streptomyces sp. NPDC059378 TaxID=3346815 RepID=UPI00367E7D59